jgi:hypothetical protein
MILDQIINQKRIGINNNPLEMYLLDIDFKKNRNGKIEKNIIGSISLKEDDILINRDIDLGNDTKKWSDFETSKTSQPAR